jgi:DNA-binding LacI/PurR family transcriptional regulator
MKSPRRPRRPVRPATIQDVARRAKVSTATVSRALAGAGVVSESLVRRVQTASRELAYRPNRVARSLRVRRSRTIGVLIPDIQNPFFTGVIRGIEDRLQATDHTLLLVSSDDDPARERAYVDLLKAEGVGGLILVPGLAGARPYRDLLDEKIALCAIDRLLPDLPCDSVTVTNAEGAALAVRHLCGLGHRRVAIVTGPPDVSTARERLAGYLAALREAKLLRDPMLIQHAPFRPEGGHEATERLLALARRPTAIFAASDLTALGTLRALHEHRLRIPQDVAVISFDDMPWAAALHPPLTAVAQPTYELGATAARLLLERLRDPSRPVQRVRLQTRLVVRASCGAAATYSSDGVGDDPADEGDPVTGDERPPTPTKN